MGEDIWETEEQVRVRLAKSVLGFTPSAVGHFAVVETSVLSNKFCPVRVE